MPRQPEGCGPCRGPSSGPRGMKVARSPAHAYWSTLKDLICSTGADNAKMQAVVDAHSVSGAVCPSPAAEMAKISWRCWSMREGPGKMKVSTTKCRPRTRIPRSFKCCCDYAGSRENCWGRKTFQSRPTNHHLIQSSPFKPLALKTPPPGLMLSERQLYFLNLERPPPNPQKSVQLVG